MSVGKTLICRDCGTSFEFTTGEQDFYASKGFANEPSRCPECRKTTSRSHAPGYHGDYPHTEPEPQVQHLFAAVCAQCGKDTRAPAQLVLGDAPIYCSDCLATRREDAYAATGGWRDSW